MYLATLIISINMLKTTHVLNCIVSLPLWGVVVTILQTVLGVSGGLAEGVRCITRAPTSMA